MRHDTLSSTQDEARKTFNDFSEGTIILAKQQTKGRGKPGNVWFSPLGGLYFSIILKPKKDINDLLYITKAVAQVIVSVISFYGVSAKIKMPNDVLIDNKKIAGILIEKIKEVLIIGIGINLNIKEFPKELNATSLNLLLNQAVDCDEFLDKFLKVFTTIQDV